MTQEHWDLILDLAFATLIASLGAFGVWVMTDGQWWVVLLVFFGWWLAVFFGRRVS